MNLIKTHSTRFWNFFLNYVLLGGLPVIVCITASLLRSYNLPSSKASFTSSTHKQPRGFARSSTMSSRTACFSLCQIVAHAQFLLVVLTAAGDLTALAKFGPSPSRLPGRIYSHRRRGKSNSWTGLNVFPSIRC